MELAPACTSHAVINVDLMDLGCDSGLPVEPEADTLRSNSNSKIISAFRAAPGRDFLTKALICV